MSREITYFEAVFEAEREEMTRDERVILIGEDLGLYEKTGLLPGFGPSRIRSAPISENSFVGMAMVLQYLAETGKPLSELVAEIPRYVMLKTKMPCPAGAAEKVVARAKAAFALSRSRSPFENAVTPVPTSATIPEGSWPMATPLR